MRLLILGGTVFLGRHIAEDALVRGHELTLFNRGQHNPELFPEAEHVRGDRDGGLEPLRGREFDAVIDTCGYVPRIVRASAELLSDMVDRYVFVSSISVYEDFTQTDIPEDAPLETIEDESTEEYIGPAYGALKALCENEVVRVFGEDALCVRPGLIVGPHDRSDRFGYWVRRLVRGGEVLIPHCPEQQVQFIDARDLGAWILDMVERGDGGTFNATGPAEKLVFRDFLAGMAAALDADVDFTPVPEPFLMERGVGPWTDLPLWVTDQYAGMLSADVTRAIDEGLMFRPMAETVRDVLAYEEGRPADTEYRTGLTSEREAEELEAWKSAREKK